MENNKPEIAPVLPIPARRYFSTDELCALAGLTPEQFVAWQCDHGTVIGYGGEYYTRADVIRVRKLAASFGAGTESLEPAHTDRNGNPAISFDEAREELEKLLKRLESTLAK